MKGSFFRNLIIGKDNYIESWALYKRVILTGQLSVLSLVIGFLYILLDLFNQSYNAFFVYFLVIGVSLLTLFLNRMGHYTIAKAVFLFFSNLDIFIVYEMENYGTGAFTFFIVCILNAFTLFSYDEKVKSYVFSMLSVTLFFVAFNFDIPLITASDFPPEYAGFNMGMNFIVVSITSAFIVNFILRVNHKSEEELLRNEHFLRESSKELAISKRRFELAVQGSGAGIWDWDAINDKVYVSPYLAQLLGYNYHEIQNITRDRFLKVIHEDDLEHFLEQVEQQIKNRRTFKAECRFEKGDGSYLWVLYTGQVKYNEEGRAIRLVGSVMDISDRKEAEEKVNEQNQMLEKTNAELDRFVYSTSHDLRAPLSSLLGLINIAKFSNCINERNQLLSMMKDRIDTLNGFIADIIDYSRNSRLNVVKEKIFLKDMMEETVSNLQYFEHSQQIIINAHGLEDYVFYGDRSRLKIILNNVMANAIKYHNLERDAPFIHVRAWRLENLLTIAIEDNGDGIDPELEDKIFDMFFRASEKSEGSGLGLYIAREMADKLEGSISVESVAGKGATFTITIPVDFVEDTLKQDANA